MSFNEQKTLALCQNNNLLNHAANCEIFCMRSISQNTVSRSVRKGILRNFAKFTEKHLCQSLFFHSY